ncbi:Sap-like sulfolipid-1-addressing protein [Blastococcus xanthinilyticus]|uniref:Sap-like sulfolipid-1-addressing protein n=1 Tax=Blastococcus xanthinilyticus TaxID=1564164 RepID=A0A5S5D019_9ACTN|nr:Sap-like sulfolipid-1-addressing protein [Blastococcus xanthinilyticus]
MSLVVLALVDSTSVGTLVLPLWFLLAPGRVRVGRVLLFLGTVAGFYLALGVALQLGAGALLDPVGDALESPAGRIAQLVVGVVLVVLGLTIEPWTAAGKERKRAARAARGPGRLARLRDGARGDGPRRAVVLLAVTAAGIEAASMVPYLAAIALLTASGLGPLASLAVLTGYCLVMVLPALVLLGVRTALGDRLSPALGRLEGWMSRNSGETLAWVLFLLGLYVAGGAFPLT